MSFELTTEFQPRGDQPKAIDALLQGFAAGRSRQTLLGVTGSGKTFTMAHVIAELGVPTLILAHNKTLAAQLFSEFRSFFPQNAVEYFISFYDYYQPEAYIPTSDTYIEKDTLINDDIDRLRHGATRSLLLRRDVIVVASVSCIYGLGSPETYRSMLLPLEVGDRISRRDLLAEFVRLHYRRKNNRLYRGTFRVRGDVVEIVPAFTESGLRVELFDDEIEGLSTFDPLTGRTLGRLDATVLMPNSHYVTPRDQLERAIQSIQVELQERLKELDAEGKKLEARRLADRTLYDLEMLREIGFCHGIENYSRHLTGRAPGEPPPTLLDYLPDDALIIIDESHQTVPQLRAMYRGDRRRKLTLVEHGFRLPSALDNRPLRFDEFEARVGRALFVSATPGPYEIEESGGVVVEQIIRPTGLVDPQVEVHPARHQTDHLLAEIRAHVDRGDRVLVTTLTKRMAEELTDYYARVGVRCRYLHADIDALERWDILRELRRGDFDVLIGINLLREGLDLPEVSLVAILDADKEGFLRSATALIQTIGRCARNVQGRALLYADRITPSMRRAIDETERRRRLQEEHNQRLGITPQTISKGHERSLLEHLEGAAAASMGLRVDEAPPTETPDDAIRRVDRIEERIRELTAEMHARAEALEYEAAARLRDRINALKARLLVMAS